MGHSRFGKNVFRPQERAHDIKNIVNFLKSNDIFCGISLNYRLNTYMHVSNPEKAILLINNKSLGYTASKPSASKNQIVLRRN